MDGMKRNGSDTFGFVLFNALRGVFVRGFLFLVPTWELILVYFITFIHEN
jgi:hypothetical protein